MHISECVWVYITFYAYKEICAYIYIYIHIYIYIIYIYMRVQIFTQVTTHYDMCVCVRIMYTCVCASSIFGQSQDCFKLASYKRYSDPRPEILANSGRSYEYLSSFLVLIIKMAPRLVQDRLKEAVCVLFFLWKKMSKQTGVVSHNITQQKTYQLMTCVV